MSSWFKSPAPKLVKQDTSKFQCWAASLESWIACAKPGTPMAAMNSTQADLIRAYKDFTGAKDGLMVAKAMIQVMFDFQMMLDIHAPGSAVTGGKIAQRLYSRGYLWMFYLGGQMRADLGHAEVVYGISDANSPQARLHTMDPWTGTLSVTEIQDIALCKQVFVCWKETSPTWSDDMFKIMKAMVDKRGVV